MTLLCSNNVIAHIARPEIILKVQQNSHLHQLQGKLNESAMVRSILFLQAY